MMTSCRADSSGAERIRRSGLGGSASKLRSRESCPKSQGSTPPPSEEPFTTLLPENVFNCALYLWPRPKTEGARMGEWGW